LRPQAIYFILIVAVCVVLVTLALVFYVVRKISPSWFRLSVALTRTFSFSVEMDSRAQKAIGVPDPSLEGGGAVAAGPRRRGGRNAGPGRDAGERGPYS
jgi:hypothetical protein